jgi:hypothetical protein
MRLLTIRSRYTEKDQQIHAGICHGRGRVQVKYVETRHGDYALKADSEVQLAH